MADRESEELLLLCEKQNCKGRATSELILCHPPLNQKSLNARCATVADEAITFADSTVAELLNLL